MVFDIDIAFNGIIGVCFLAITATIIYGAATSPLPFFKYVGLVFASFIGVCGLARLSRLACFLLDMSRARSTLIIDIADGFSAFVGLASAIAIVAITIVVSRLSMEEGNKSS